MKNLLRRLAIHHAPNLYDAWVFYWNLAYLKSLAAATVTHLHYSDGRAGWSTFLHSSFKSCIMSDSGTSLEDSIDSARKKLGLEFRASE